METKTKNTIKAAFKALAREFNTDGLVDESASFAKVSTNDNMVTLVLYNCNYITGAFMYKVVSVLINRDVQYSLVVNGGDLKLNVW